MWLNQGIRARRVKGAQKAAAKRAAKRGSVTSALQTARAKVGNPSGDVYCIVRILLDYCAQKS